MKKESIFIVIMALILFALSGICMALTFHLKEFFLAEIQNPATLERVKNFILLSRMLSLFLGAFAFGFAGLFIWRETKEYKTVKTILLVIAFLVSIGSYFLFWEYALPRIFL